MALYRSVSYFLFQIFEAVELALANRVSYSEDSVDLIELVPLKIELLLHPCRRQLKLLYTTILLYPPETYALFRFVRSR
jgi:hypothetical protein